MPKNYFQRSGCRHVELSKIAVLVTWPLFACNSTSAIQLSHTSAKMAPRYEKRFSIWRPCSLFGICENCRFVKVYPRDVNIPICILNLIGIGKFASELCIQSYFQNGARPSSWVFENCRFGHVTYICMWFFISAPNFALISQDIAKTRFSIWRPSAILNLQNFDFFCQISILGIEIYICIPVNPISITMTSS